MDIYEFAMKMEEDGKQLYLEIAEKTDSEGVRKIFEQLAADEQRHKEVVEKLREKAPDVGETSVLEDAKNIFEKIKDSKEKIDPSVPQADLYRKAREIEKKSEDFYREKSTEESDPEKSSVLGRLAEEERKHFFLLDNMVEFIGRPQTWLENAEFNHLDEY